jgi:hypothetical protein
MFLLGEKVCLFVGMPFCFLKTEGPYDGLKILAKESDSLSEQGIQK